MTHAIIGFGPVGQALAEAFAREGLDVMVARFVTASTTCPPRRWRPIPTSTAVAV